MVYHIKLIYKFAKFLLKSAKLKRIVTYFLVLLIILSWSCNKDDNPEHEGFIASNLVYAIYVDDNGIKWFGTDKGLCSYNGKKWNTYAANNYLADNKVRDIAFRMSNQGPELWLATGSGADALITEGSDVASSTTYNTTNSEIIGDDVLSVGLDAGNNRWFGTTEGVSVFDGDNWTSTIHAGTLVDHPVVDIGADQGGYTFLATNGAGVAVLEYELDAISTVTYYEYPWSPVPEDEIITSVYVEPSGTQWYGTDTVLLEHYSTDAKAGWNLYTKEQDGLPSNHVTAITGDGLGTIWIGTRDAGVASFDGSAWTSYSTTDGLISNSVTCIAVDTDGSIWIGTGSGVSHFQGGTWTTYRAE